MAPTVVAEGVRTASDFLDDHWILKWFVVPVCFMASVLLVLFLAVSTASNVEILQVVGLYVAFSLSVVAVGLLIERVLAEVFGIELFHSRSEYE